MNKKNGTWESRFIIQAMYDSVYKLNPVSTFRNPVMFTVELGAIVATLITIYNIFTGMAFWFNFQISMWLWFTVIFSNFAEALAEGKSKAQAESLKRSRSDVVAKRILPDGTTESIEASHLRKDDIVLVEDGYIIPSDGDIVEGVALVDESAITGESAPVIREFGGDRSAVTGGTRVLSGAIKVKITANPGETFLDQMIKMIEDARRQKTPNEKALDILLVGLTALFSAVVFSLYLFAGYMEVEISVPILVALLVCLVPTTIGGLLPAIGIAGMDRLMSNNVMALSGRAVEAAGDVNVVLLDKTGTITLGNRSATEFIPVHEVPVNDLSHAALLSSLSDNTPEGRSVIILAKEKLQIRGRDIVSPENSKFIEFSAETRVSGVDIGSRQIRKGAADAIEKFVQAHGGSFSSEVKLIVEKVAGGGGTPLVVAENERILGVICLKDVLKKGIKERLQKLRLMGIQSVMITGDNPLTAAAIAAEAGVDDFIAHAKPKTKLERIRSYQKDGYMVAMIGDGTNDAPALAQADVAVAMNAGTQAAREAANMIDLDSNPTKLLDIVEIGKQILITRGALTTFSVTNDVAKYFTLIPALFSVKFPLLNVLNIMNLSSPKGAILSTIIFNALIIPCLIPLSLKGVQYKKGSAEALLIRNLLIYGLGGLILPFIGIKLIDIVAVFFDLI